MRLELILFSDALLIAKAKKNKLKYIRFVPIDKVIADESEDSGMKFPVKYWLVGSNHFKLDTFGWVYNLVVDAPPNKENLIFTIDNVKKQHREFLAENNNNAGFGLTRTQSISLTR